MCGIVGAFGTNRSNEIVLNGLEILEYRGYDSCGINYLKDNEYKIIKSTDRINNLKEKVSEQSLISFGHTRWATHGKVSLDNCHPHISGNKKLTMVHNGVIENYLEIKEELGIELYSQTDTEIILNLIEYLYKQTNDMKEALSLFIKKVHGSYACIISNIDEPNNIYIIRNKTPLLIGKKDDYFTVSSDPVAVNESVKEFCSLEDKTFGIINLENKEVQLFDKDINTIEANYEHIDLGSIDLNNNADFDTYMEEEIYSQPKVLNNIIEHYKNNEISKDILDLVNNCSKIYIVASGTSYFAGLIGKYIFEEVVKKKTEVVIGSEFGYKNNLIDEDDMFIFLSQSGETADSILVLDSLKNRTLALTNTPGSTIDRECDYSLNLMAGPELAVASTKAYTAQIAVMSLLANEIIGNKDIYKELEEVKEIQQLILDDKEKLKEIAKNYIDIQEIFYIGRLRDYDTCEEASLKIKEVSYKNVNAYPAGELKHGTISLIDTNKLSVGIISSIEMNDKTRSNLEEIKTRDGKVLIFSTECTKKSGDDYVIPYSKDSYLCSLLTVIPHQILSLHISTALGLDVDKPRNLAKSVTVE
ncbi:MAG: glutamine--fructose-6-phosphate transaminase (isomerizing) [Mycoplasmatales bacterium]